MTPAAAVPLAARRSLVVFAALIATNSMNMIANWMLQFWPTIG